MNRVFYIFRHGETDWNKEQRCQGHTNVPLNDTGKMQARELAAKLHQFPLEVIVSSDLDRAQMTGSMVATQKGIPIIIDARLREMHYGAIEGMFYQDAIDLYGNELWERLKSFRAENDSACFPGGETRKESRDRFLASLDEMIRLHPYEHIGISTHGGVLRSVVHNFLPPDHPMIPIPNCVIYKIIYDAQTKLFTAMPEPL